MTAPRPSGARKKPRGAGVPAPQPPGLCLSTAAGNRCAREKFSGRSGRPGSGFRCYSDPAIFTAASKASQAAGFLASLQAR